MSVFIEKVGMCFVQGSEWCSFVYGHDVVLYEATLVSSGL